VSRSVTAQRYLYTCANRIYSYKTGISCKRTAYTTVSEPKGSYLSHAKTLNVKYMKFPFSLSLLPFFCIFLSFSLPFIPRVNWQRDNRTKRYFFFFFFFFSLECFISKVSSKTMVTEYSEYKCSTIVSRHFFITHFFFIKKLTNLASLVLISFSCISIYRRNSSCDAQFGNWLFACRHVNYFFTKIALLYILLRTNMLRNFQHDIRFRSDYQKRRITKTRGISNNWKDKDKESLALIATSAE